MTFECYGLDTYVPLEFIYQSLDSDTIAFGDGTFQNHFGFR
jgi:hypothetical protein